MLAEKDPKGRRSKGAKTYIRRQKQEARKTGRRFDAPPAPTVRSPEQRTEWDTVIAPIIKELPTYNDNIAPHMAAVEDFWQTRRRVTFEGLDPMEAATDFDSRHPELNRDHSYDQLRPAFEIILGRFRQVTNAASSRRR